MESKEKRVFILPLEVPLSLKERMMATPEGQEHPEEVDRMWREIVNMHKKHVQAYTNGQTTFTYKGKKYNVASQILKPEKAAELTEVREEIKAKIDDNNTRSIESDSNNVDDRLNSSDIGGTERDNEQQRLHVDKLQHMAVSPGKALSPGILSTTGAGRIKGANPGRRRVVSPDRG